ncbi:MAG: hypothetical protein K0U41_09060 [Gammaproteobacteria bacterium]|nr:hypothetical protein [Gammaproteobacteria bacterium]
MEDPNIDKSDLHKWTIKDRWEQMIWAMKMDINSLKYGWPLYLVVWYMFLRIIYAFAPNK